MKKKWFRKIEKQWKQRKKIVLMTKTVKYGSNEHAFNENSSVKKLVLSLLTIFLTNKQTNYDVPSISLERFFFCIWTLGISHRWWCRPHHVYQPLCCWSRRKRKRKDPERKRKIYEVDEAFPGPTDLRTDGRTDTTSYRDATAHLKTSFF